MGVLHRRLGRRGEVVRALLDEETGTVVMVVLHLGRGEELIGTNVHVRLGPGGWEVVLDETETRILRTSWPT
jgi:hypothetical protein